MRQKVPNTAFISFNFGKGFGGHYLSMSETARSGIFLEPIVIDLGFSPTPLLEDIRTRYIAYGWTRHKNARRLLRETISNAGTKTILCYDIAAYNISRQAFIGLPVSVVYVKCGGPTLTMYYPKPDNLIVFSDEDEDFFREKLPEAVSAKIPNRVSEKALKQKQIMLSDAALAQWEERGELEKVVCVARIGHSYESKIQRSFDYLRARHIAGRKATLTVIGSVQHEEVHERLLKDRPPGTSFLTDSYHIQDAARFLSNFDSAITTGRGTVEASLVGLKVLVPYDGGAQLAVLSPQSYTGFRRSNFSGRASPDEVVERMPHDASSEELKLVSDWIRRDFAIEHAAPKFAEFLTRVKQNARPRHKELFIASLYFYYVALRERSQLARYLLQTFKRVKPFFKRLSP